MTTLREAEAIARPPIIGIIEPMPFTIQDIMLAAYRVKQKYGISAVKEVRAAFEFKAKTDG